MNPIFITIYRSNVWAFPIFAIVLFVANWLMGAEPIPMKQLLLVSALFLLYYSWVYYIISNFWVKNLKKRMAATAATLLLVFTIEPTLIFLIYHYFPSLGVHMDRYMDDPGYEPDTTELRQRYGSAIIFLCVLVVIRLSHRGSREKSAEVKRSNQRTNGLEKEISNLNSLLKARNLNPHFMGNFAALALGRERKKHNEENIKMLTMLIALMNYQLRMDGNQQTTRWQDEWEQIESLLEMAYYRDPKFVYEWSDNDCLADLEMIIPHGLLLMPLENALKYGENTAEWPLRMGFSRKDDRIHIRYTNYFDPLKRDKIESTGQGFPLMEARLAGGSWPIAMRRQEEGDCFCVDIEIIDSISKTYDDEKKAKV
ncbi:LytS family sensor histidine kinase [Sphingobacterium arenae]|uniref:Histidine kinase n=1 Tax=Sphingobacterium arenae TaxID=1280598 RepID=A0ABR7Y1N0_9SPHI|nr:hypothetical protein [Sphingobacterium arenae]MBD1425208.1 hypothetical protein [Sphingobacterium arenae]